MTRASTRCMGLWLAIAWALAAALPARAEEPRAAVAPGPGWSFERSRGAQHGEPLTAVAIDAELGRIAVGDGTGVSLSIGGGSFRRAARTGAVSDLYFAPDGALWIAAADGLWHLGLEGRVQRRALAPGEAARLVHRLAGAGEWIAAGTEAGAFVSRDGVEWQRVDAEVSSGPVKTLAARALAGGEALELWLVVASDPWRVEVERRGARLVLRSARRETVVGAPAGVAPVDLSLSLPDVDVALLYPRSLALRAAQPPVAGMTHWSVWRPVLPPGAAARRVESAGGRLWLASDRGLLESDDARLPWNRAAAPAGRLAVTALAPAGHALWVASEAGLLEGRPNPLPGSLATPAGEAGVPPALGSADPDVGTVQRLALRHVGLVPERMRRLRERADRRGWLPTMALHFDYGHGRDRERDDDQTFVSGATQQLYDRTRDESHDYDTGITFVWDLADAAFDPELIDLQREARQVIGLRDDVLDEVNQLYFERQRVLLALAQQPDAAQPEARQLALRARELAAGLDAWTGGGFSAARAAPAP